MSEHRIVGFVDKHKKAEIAVGASLAGIAGAGILAHVKHVRQRRQKEASDYIAADVSQSRLHNRQQTDSTFHESSAEYRVRLKHFCDSKLMQRYGDQLSAVLAQVYYTTYHTRAGAIPSGILSRQLNVPARTADRIIAKLDKNYALINYREENVKLGHVAGYYAADILTWAHDEGVEADLPGLQTAVSELINTAAETANGGYFED